MSERAEAIRRAMSEEDQAARDDERFAVARHDAGQIARRLDAAHDRMRAEAGRDPWDLVTEMTVLVREMSTLLEAALDQMRGLKRN